ncbi:hypothetical protein EFR00_22270 [Rhizobium sophoriradicis]|uniref:hypothetical protein n=1 Tax=Rhizobium TaxID=379 RepID=UPI00098FB238|nr:MULTISPECIES: hypothetical protein [Rhizobium]ARQ56458.1 hypothetical protein Kim5_CH00338 [Rhizobium sp. Kim5]RSB92446.1 hypothetical protein EFR00_22270 [Rhizobium sophoriradicis]
MAETTFPDEFPEGAKHGKLTRRALNSISGLIPLAGGLISAAASAWGEHEQGRMNDFFRHWVEMLRAEMEEKQKTIVEIMQRLDLRDEQIADRIQSPDFQSLLRKSFREWAGAESDEKRSMVRNLLANAASSTVCSDDVVRLFLDWIKSLSDLHLAVIGKIYNQSGITRGGIWESLGRGPVREDSPEADLFRLLIRDLSTGGIIRQHRETDYAGNFLKSTRPKSRPGTASNLQKSAFDDSESYELTALGDQFVHYAMTDLPIKLTYTPEDSEEV